MSYHLFLDDARMPKDVTWIELPLVNWTIVRNYKEFVETITKNGIPTTVTFDHDLADEHYKEFVEAHNPLLIGKGRVRYENFKEKTGYDCAKWLSQYCVDNRIPLPVYYIHTMNPIGHENIEKILSFTKRFEKLINE